MNKVKFKIHYIKTTADALTNVPVAIIRAAENKDVKDALANIFYILFREEMSQKDYTCVMTGPVTIKLNPDTFILNFEVLSVLAGSGNVIAVSYEGSIKEKLINVLLSEEVTIDCDNPLCDILQIFDNLKQFKNLVNI